MKSGLSLLFLVAASFSAEAAVVRGNVIEPESKAPMEFVNVIVKSADGKVYGGVTDGDGNFSIPGVPAGNYTLTASFVGYTPTETRVTVGSGNVDIGVLALAENENLLDEVEVKAMKSQLRFDLDRKVFDVEADLAAAGTSASELLENIPSIEVDNDGEVSLRGNSSVTIWINGKDAGLTSDNRADILEQLPAESIQRVEIITNPSAKYSPEGTAGIINIVMKRGSLLGYYGAARASANTWGGYNANGSVNFNTGKWETSFSIGYRHNRSKRYNSSDRTYDDLTYLNSDQERENNRDGIFMRGSVTYYHNEQNEIYLNGFGMFGWNKNEGSTDYLSNRATEALVGQASLSDGNNQGGIVTAGYKHTFGENHTLDISTSFNGWHGPFNNTTDNRYEYPSADGSGVDVVEEWQSQQNEIRNRNVEYQADYTLPIAGKFKLEAGYDGRNSHEDSPVSTLVGPSENQMQIDPDQYNRFIYDQNIQAAYATFGGNVGNLSFQAGVRGEYWKVTTQSLAYGQSVSDVEPFTTDHFQLFPSAFLSYSFPRQNEMQINYTRRIRRPWGGQLNSFRNTSDPTNISYGNPLLNPEYSNAFELNYIKTWDEHMTSASVYYRSTDNVIQRINFIDDRTGIMNSTFDNVSQSVSAGTEIIIKNTFFRIFDLTTTANLFYYRLDGFEYTPEHSTQVVSGDGDSNFSWNIRVNARVMLPWDLSLQVNGRYNAPTVIAQGRREGNYRLDASLRKDFGKWSVSINARDILDSRRFETVTYGNGYTQTSKNWGGGRRFQLTLSYSFGNMKPKHPERPTMMDSEEMDY